MDLIFKRDLVDDSLYLIVSTINNSNDKIHHFKNELSSLQPVKSWPTNPPQLYCPFENKDEIG